MTPARHVGDGRIRYRYPTPVAAPYRQWRLASDPALELGHLLGTLESFVRTLANLLLADRLASERAFVAEARAELARPSARSLLSLIVRQLAAGPPAGALLGSLWTLDQTFVDGLTSLVEDAEVVRVDRAGLDPASADAWTIAFESRLLALLERVDELERLLLVRCEPVPGVAGLWSLVPWRGVDNARPIPVRSAGGLTAGALLVLTPDSPVALRVDPFFAVVDSDREGHDGGGGGTRPRLTSILSSAEPGRIVYHHYLSGDVMTVSGDLAAALTQLPGRVETGLDGESLGRVAAEITPWELELPGYRDGLETHVDDTGRHFRAVHQATGAVHTVTRLHERQVRTSADLAGFARALERLGRIDHPNVLVPAHVGFDSGAGTWIIGTPQPRHGRLADRLGDDGVLPVRWALQAGAHIAGALAALAAEALHVRSLPPWAIALDVITDGAVADGAVGDGGEQLRVAPLLAGMVHGEAPDSTAASALVARLVYRMVTGRFPAASPVRPSTVRHGIPESVDDALLAALSGAGDLARLADVLSTAEAPESSLASLAVRRCFAHLQRLRPGALEELEGAIAEHTHSGEWPGVVANLGPTIEAIWDPDERLERVHGAMRLMSEEMRTGAAMVGIVRRLVELDSDHLPTLLFAVREVGEQLPGSLSLQLRQRILGLAHEDAAVAAALADLATLSERRNEWASAAAFWEQLCALAPEDAAGWSGAARSARLLGDEARETAALRRLMALEGGPEPGPAVRRRLVELVSGTDPVTAARVLDALCADTDALTDWTSLRDVARVLGDEARLARALEAIIAHPESPPEQKHRAGLELAVSRGLRGNAVDEASQQMDALADQAPERAVLSVRALLHERSGRWLEAAAALETWAGAEEAPWCFGLALKRLARVCDQALGDVDRAISLYEGVLETDPTDREALIFLESAYSDRGEHAARVGVLGSLADIATDDDERAELLLRLALVQRDALDDREAAFQNVASALEGSPGFVAAIEPLVSLAQGTAHEARARALIDDALLRMAPEEAQGWRARLGQLQLDSASDVGELVGRFRAQVAEAPTNIDALEGLLGATARVGRWEEHAEVLERLIQLSADRDTSLARLRALAETLRDRVLAPRRAVRALERILAIEPDDEWALAALSAVGEAAGRSPRDRVRTLQRWVELCSDPDAQLNALEALAALAEPAGLPPRELVRVLEQIEALDPANATALTGLERHYLDNGEFARAAAVIARRVDVADPTERPVHLERLARLCAGRAKDPAQAIAALQRLQREHPDHPVDPDLVYGTLVAAGEYRALVELLAARSDATLKEDERAELLYRQGIVVADHLDDLDEAIALMERALANDEHHLGALGFLGDVYYRQSRWTDARPVLEALGRAIDASDEAVNPALEVEAWCRVGEVREALGEDDRAAGAYERVLSMEADNLRGLNGLARVAAVKRDYDAAERHYRRLLDVHGPAMSPDDRAAVQAALGELALARGDDGRSRELLEGVLDSGQRSPEMLRELIVVCERQGDHAAVARHRVALAETFEEPLARFAVLVELAETYRQHLGDHDAARKTLEEAHLLKPDSIAVSVSLLEVHLALGRYKEAVDTLLGLVDREGDSARRARFTYSLAAIYRDHLHEPRRAVAYLKETLDLDPSRLDAFEALDALLNKHKDWSGQAAAYDAMLSRQGPEADPALLIRLNRNLARIHASALGQPRPAIAALRRALALDPHSAELQLELARLLEQVEPAGEAALSAYRAVLDRDVNRTEAWQALGRIFAKRGDRDAAWCVCSVIRQVGELDAREAAFYARHDKPALALRRALSGPDDWERFLYDPAEDLLLGRIFELIARVLADGMATKRLADLGLTPRDRVSLDQRGRFTSFLGTVSKILRVPIPAVYRSAEARGIRKEPLYPPIMVVGPEVLTGRKGKELRFAIGKAMAYFLPGHLLAGMFPAGHLRTILLGAMRSVMPDVSQAGEPGVRGIVRLLTERMRRGDAEALAQLTGELAEREESPNLNEWLCQVERTANHAGHLLSNDLEVSLRLIAESERQDGQPRWSKLTTDAASADLMRWVASDRYLALRKQLGAAITTD